VSLARLAQPLLGVLWQQPPVRLRGRPAESGDRVAWPRRRGTRRPRLHCDPSESLLTASPDHYQLGMKILADYVRWERPNQLTPPRPHLGRLTLYLLPRLQCRDGGGKVRPLLPARQRPPHNAQLAGDLLIAVGVLKAQRRRPPHLLHCRRQVAPGGRPRSRRCSSGRLGTAAGPAAVCDTLRRRFRDERGGHQGSSESIGPLAAARVRAVTCLEDSAPCRSLPVAASFTTPITCARWTVAPLRGRMRAAEGTASNQRV
jgi:hypothetical protein